MFDDERGLVGQLDAAYVDQWGQLILVAWKRQHRIRQKNTGTRAKPPLQDKDDCELVRYGMQMHLYKHILETYYDKSVKAMFVVAMYHPLHRSIDRNTKKIPLTKTWKKSKNKLRKQRETAASHDDSESEEESEDS